MITVRKLKTSLLCLCLGSVTFLLAEQKPTPFGIESGTVIYQIRGGTQLTPDTNLNLQGKAILHFKEWGEVKTEELNGSVETSGALPYREVIKRFKKETKDAIITVDYKNEQLLERKKSSVKKDIQRMQTNHLTKKGTEIVAGIICDVWETTGVKKCIYKGVVLKLESHVYDLSYVKEAIKVNFDSNGSEACTLPDYPIHQFGLFRDNIKTKNKLKSEDFCKVINDIVSDPEEHNQSTKVSDFEDPKRKKFIDRISRDIFEKQKVLLPKLLDAMKKMRECLQVVENPFEANRCSESFSSMKSKMGDDEKEYIVLWSEKRKNELLDKIEDEIIDLESRIACVKRSKNIYDLSNCMK